MSLTVGAQEVTELVAVVKFAMNKHRRCASFSWPLARRIVFGRLARLRFSHSSVGV